METYKNIPITSARKIADKYDKDQVIIIAWDKLHNMTHVTTFGRTIKDCEQAAEGGNKLKKVLGWPDELCHAVPARVKKRRLIKN